MQTILAIGVGSKAIRIAVRCVSIGLDQVQIVEVSDTNRIRGAKLEKSKKSWQLHMYAESKVLLERWALGKRKSLFEEVFEVRLEVR